MATKNRKRIYKSDPVGQATIKDFRKGTFVRLITKNGQGKKTYIRGEYDRSLKKYHLIDCSDVWGNGRYVKGSALANDDFEY